MAEGDSDRPETVVMVEEDVDRPEMVHDNLRPVGLRLGRDLDLLLGMVVAEGDADRPEIVVMVEDGSIETASANHDE